MGCICAKPAAPRPEASPGFGFSAAGGSEKYAPSFRNSSRFFDFDKGTGDESERHQSRELRKLKKGSYNERSSLSMRLGLSRRFVEAEQTAAGWPSWLSTAASEAIQGWIPLKADSFEKLEKIGQGTYSSVFRAREVETGKMVALKKVRFDNFQPESIRFMAREITILRRLNHPNVMKLEGIITSRLSSNIYLVFEYMEHDLAGLISCPDIKFSDAQVKCYMKQLLLGIEHCHLRGIIHRDIKVSNILVNNEGILKLGDFGLANILSSKQLTSRVVTLWYRPPELLMGSTSYGVSVDLWSVGCVFAELLFRKPLLKGRTEVEQLHKIFKLCGSPPDEFWKMSKIPRSTMFKPQHSYDSSLQEKCKGIASSAVNLIETFLSIEPYKRGTASSALMSEYFKTLPYACDPSSLPKYLPNKEIDAKHREEARRKRNRARLRESEAMKKPTRVRKALHEPSNGRKFLPKEEVQNNNCLARRNIPNEKGANRDQQKPSFDAMSGISDFSNISQGQSMLSGPINVTSSSNFAWVKKRKDEPTVKRSYSRSSSRSQVSALDHSSIVVEPSARQQDGISVCELSSLGDEVGLCNNSFGMSEFFHSRDLSMELNQRGDLDLMGFEGIKDRVEFSGPMLTQSHKIDELLQRNENHIRQAVRRSRLDRTRVE
ncbi:protein IMPAIRED IN BABA-INDUCED STERILITY 1-like isoform X1 [Punica granatum]|uniref:Uncharacterized protein n=2 Tax=Punica granatum TaxID=22663 RepID=A0A2I0I5N3_PUNGR|nr:protein IMPAIRED IN BABA-INDUCED STERILITY 1-like isoform X1 [Punica granatum]PKI38726.1 hypothetical protein CRG98_040839 [Punica granatum]